jgi:hypothetical protein
MPRKSAQKKIETVYVQLSGPVIVPRRMTIPQLAAYLSEAPRAVEDLLRNGEIPFHVNGKKKVVERSDADEWASKQPAYRGKLDEHGKPTSALPKEVEFILRLNLPKTKRDWLLRKLDHLNREADCRRELDGGGKNPGGFYKPRSLKVIDKCRQEILTELASLAAIEPA